MTKNAGKNAVTISPQQLVELYQSQRALFNAMLEQEQFLQAALIDIHTASDALREISELEKDTRALVMLGSGMFLEVGIKGKKVKSEVGGGVVQDVTVKKALEQLEEKHKTISDNASKLQKRKQDALKGMARLESMVQQLQNAIAQDNKKQEGPASVS